MVETIKAVEKVELAAASFEVGSVSTLGDVYFPGQAANGITPEKLLVPKQYHQVIALCYDFYQRGGIVATVVNRLVELAITDITNGQRNTTDEANEYFDVILHRQPSRLNRFIHAAALEYFLSGMVVPRVDWVKRLGSELSPKLKPNKEYLVPTFDLYPPNLIQVEWVGWGKKNFYLKVPQKDLKLLRGSAGKIKKQQSQRVDMWTQNFPDIINIVGAGANLVELKEIDPILRKETSITPYPTPYLYNILEALIFKQQLRRMDFAVASRVVNAIMLVQEGDKDFPAVQENQGNINKLKAQIMGRTADPRLQERLFMLFTNHTTKITWITPDLTSLLEQDKYRQTNDEIGEGLGFAKILLTGESRNAQASEVSTWAIQPMMEEVRSALMEFMIPIYEEAAELNKFRNVSVPNFDPIRLQDYIKTAAVYAQLFKEGNISRTTRDQMAGIKFQDETERMTDEAKLMEPIPDVKPMPYDITDPENAVGPAGGGPGRPPGAPKGGRPTGSQNVPVNKRNQGVKPKGQQPTSRVAASVNELLNDDELLELMNQTMEERGLVLDIDKEGALKFKELEG